MRSARRQTAMRDRSCAIESCEPCQTGNRAALSSIFGVPQERLFRACLHRSRAERRIRLQAVRSKRLGKFIASLYCDFWEVWLLYQALYRKWRPKTFSEMSGQDAVRTVLKREVLEGRLSHAYLFCGTRGTGKTTAAKILAKAANCLIPDGGDPCGKCAMCLGIDNGSVLDVVEIDAASNNGVEHVREIREQVQFAPVETKFRVYIIDEVHMLTSNAFNALLKTLEEPPPHVIFILATTERHKIPATIMSRCQCFDFTRISLFDISSRLADVAAAENIALDEAACNLIALLADGALRNALSILDQCAISGGDVTVKTVETVAGLANRRYLFAVSKALAKRDVGALISAVSDAALQSKDLIVIVGELMTHFRDLLVIKSVISPDELLKSPPSEFGELKSMATEFDSEYLLKVLKTLQQATFEISKSPVRQTLLEAVLLELCRFEGGTPAAAQKSPQTARAEKYVQNAKSMPIEAEGTPVQNAADKPSVAPPPQSVADTNTSDRDLSNEGSKKPASDSVQNADFDNAKPKANNEKNSAASGEKVDFGSGKAASGDEELVKGGEKSASKDEESTSGGEKLAKSKDQSSATGTEKPASGGEKPDFWGALTAALDPAISPVVAGAAVTVTKNIITIEPDRAFGLRMLSKDSWQKEITDKILAVTGQMYELHISAKAQSEQLDNLVAFVAQMNESEG